jgi:hypothetical protein
MGYDAKQKPGARPGRETGNRQITCQADNEQEAASVSSLTRREHLARLSEEPERSAVHPITLNIARVVAVVVRVSNGLRPNPEFQGEICGVRHGRVHDLPSGAHQVFVSLLPFKLVPGLPVVDGGLRSPFGRAC